MNNLNDLKEQLQEDILTYIEGKAFLHQDQFKDDLCQIVVDRVNELKMNEWEQLEEHIQDNLGYYGLKFQDKFLELKEHAEDLGLCPPDTPERQDKFAEQNG